MILTTVFCLLVSHVCVYANILQFALPRACIVHFRVLIKSVRVRVLRYFSAFRFRKGIKILKKRVICHPRSARVEGEEANEQVPQ